MSSINKTPHYNLSQFGDSPDDKPSWRGDYTADMSKIDSQMYRNETDATTATNTANTAKSTADSALSQAQTNKNDTAEQASYFNALGVTSLGTAQSLMSTINAKAENSAVTALQGTVSALSDTVDAENSAVTALQGTVSALSDTVDTKANASEVYTRSQADARYTQQGGYAGSAQQLNNSLEKLLSSLRPIEILNSNFNFHGIGAGNSGRANVRAFAIPGCKIALARVMIFSSNSDTLEPGKWPGSPVGASTPEQSTTGQITIESPAVVCGTIPAEYRPPVPFRGYPDFALSSVWGLAVEIWPNGDVEVREFSGKPIPTGTFINAPSFNLVWTYGHNGI